MTERPTSPSAAIEHCPNCAAMQERMRFAEDEAVRQARIGNGAMIEVDQLRRALEQVRQVAGHVCDSYETCDHRTCQSSYAAWAIADAALNVHSHD
jgi:hypothetical protein